MATDITVGRAALMTVLDAAGLGELTTVLAPPAVWIPPDERGELLDAAWKEVERAGLAAHGRVDDETWAWLRVLAAPAEERYAWTSNPGTHATAVLAATRAEHGMLAILDGEQLRLRRIEPDELDETLVAVLPECPAGRKTMRLTLGEPGEDSVFDDDSREFEDFAASPPIGLTELYAACTPHLGTRRAVHNPIWVRDTTQGRYLLRLTREEAIAEPGDRASLVRALRQARRGLGS